MVERRDFLTAAAAGAVALSAPGWIARAFAQDSDSDVEAEDDGNRDRSRELQDLSAAYRRAQQQGRPLLVLVVPEDGGLRWERAHAFGELLNNGSDETFAVLALTEVACSTMRTLRRLVPQAGAGEPWLVMVEPHTHPATARQVEVQVPEWPNQWTERGQPDFEQRMEQAIDERISILAAVVRNTVARDDDMISARARVAEQHLDAALVRRAHAAVRRGRVSAELASSAPAIVAAASRRSPNTAIQHALAEQARERLTQRRIDGSYWATSRGCGVTVEGRDDNAIIGCGMGHVPARSARFLYWYNPGSGW